jgi:hypothetical protein
MAQFHVSFSQTGLIIPPAKVEAATVEEALEAAWRANASTFENASATALGLGHAYRFIRRDGQWVTLASVPIPEAP